MRKISYNPSRRARRYLAAAVAGLALPLVVALSSAGPAGAAAAAASPSPTPCPLVGLSTGCPAIGLGGGPSPSSSPTPSSSSSGAAGAPTGAGGSTPGSSASAAAGAAAGAAPARSSAPAIPGTPSFLELVGLLAPPPNVGVERPALHHFALAAGGVSLASTGTASGSGTAASSPAHRGSPRSLWPVAAVAVLLTLGAILTFRRRTTLRLRRRARLAAAPLAGSLVMIALLAATQGAGATVAPVSHPAPPVALHTAVTVVHRMPTQAEALWSRLTGIEATVGQNQAQLAVLSSLATQTAADNASVSPPRGSPSVVKDPQDARTQVAAAYQSALQTEYDFFVGTVRDDGQRQALIAAAQAAPAPIRDAVVYDVAAVQAELAQEAAIAAAQQAIPAAIGPAPKSLATPLSGAISQPFGPSSLGFEPQMTFNGVTYPHFHTGIDIAAPLDTPVHAAADGIVVLAGPSTDAAGHLVGYGNYVVIAHAGKMITLYGHLDQLLVHAGQPVHAGDVIGLEGSTGYSTGPHLHFEVRVGGLLTDPLPFLAAQLHHQ